MHGSIDTASTEITTAKESVFRETLKANKRIQDTVLNHRILTKDEEYLLVQKFQAGDVNARSVLCKHNYRFVYKVVCMYKNPNSDSDFWDVFQVGVTGLMRAAEDFNIAQGFRFASYAVWWIKQRINFYINNDAMIRVLGKDAESIRQDLIETSEDTKLIKYLATKTRTSAKINSSVQYISLDASNSDGNTLQDILPSTSITYDHDAASVKEFLPKILSGINKRERYLLETYYGLIGEPLTYREMSRHLGISHERVRQLMVKALKNVNNYMRIAKLSRSDLGSLECSI